MIQQFPNMEAARRGMNHWRGWEYRARHILILPKAKLILKRHKEVVPDCPQCLETKTDESLVIEKYRVTVSAGKGSEDRMHWTTGPHAISPEEYRSIEEELKGKEKVIHSYDCCSAD